MAFKSNAGSQRKQCSYFFFLFAVVGFSFTFVVTGGPAGLTGAASGAAD